MTSVALTPIAPEDRNTMQPFARLVKTFGRVLEIFQTLLIQLQLSMIYQSG